MFILFKPSFLLWGEMECTPPLNLTIFHVLSLFTAFVCCDVIHTWSRERTRTAKNTCGANAVSQVPGCGDRGKLFSSYKWQFVGQFFFSNDVIYWSIVGVHCGFIHLTLYCDGACLQTQTQDYLFRPLYNNKVRAASHYTISVVRRIRLDALCHDKSSQVILANDWHQDPCDALHDWFPTIVYNLTIYRDVSDIFEHAQNVTTACDTHWLLE